MEQRQILPDSLIEFWNKWDIRATLVTSLGLQTVLIIVGNRRKHSAGKFVRFSVWLAYLTADWIATVSLSLIFGFGDKNESHGKPDQRITAFWAPFLLLHFGGPDTITSYSLEDNELWWRHLFTHAVQVSFAFYVILVAWTANDALNFLAILIFMAGVLKIGERTWVQRCTSSNYFRKGMLNPPDPGPDYARFMGEYHSKRLEGFEVSSAKMFEASKAGEHVSLAVTPAMTRVEDDLEEAYRFFEVFKQLFADLILSVYDKEKSQYFFNSSSFETAFRVVEIELGFIFDVFYTKWTIIYSLAGGIIRAVSFLLTFLVFLLFYFVEKGYFTRLDKLITYVFLTGAISLEIYALVMILCSDRTMTWLKKQDNTAADAVCRTISWFCPLERKRWSNQVAQFNLISLCFKEKPAKWFCLNLQKAICISETMEMDRYKGFSEIPMNLKDLIFDRLRRRSQSSDTSGNSVSEWGKTALAESHCLDELGWSIVDVQFDQSLLLWHIATDLWYYSDETILPTRENSKLMSEYMLYLLVMRPSMLPDGIGQIRFQDTRAEGDKFFAGRNNTVQDPKKARRALLDVSVKIPPSEVKGDRSKSVLFDACKLAKDLQELEKRRKWDKAKKWELVSRVWVEMVSHAASQCQRIHHVHQLRRGGELLTHVWLLMAHLGITEQFQISKGHARAKLVAE